MNLDKRLAMLNHDCERFKFSEELRNEVMNNYYNHSKRKRIANIRNTIIVVFFLVILIILLIYQM